ncbi:MAG TPA: plastocyanin/azurin family copper-binding protein [Acidimicrobiia bacterium]|nr:plastocyanin/azurin family copper-binding protein [Acidimicrobiia bacterium]
MSAKSSRLWVAAGIAASMLVIGMPARSGTHIVDIQGKTFMPREEIIGVGDTIEWRHNDGGELHSVTADDGSFDSHPSCGPSSTGDCMKAGEVFKHTFKQEGRYQYFSKLHGAPGRQGMAGAIVVVAKSGASSSTSSTR